MIIVTVRQRDYDVWADDLAAPVAGEPGSMRPELILEKLVDSGKISCANRAEANHSERHIARAIPDIPGCGELKGFLPL